MQMKTKMWQMVRIVFEGLMPHIFAQFTFVFDTYDFVQYVVIAFHSSYDSIHRLLQLLSDYSLSPR